MRLLTLPGVFQPPSDAWLLAEYFAREQLAKGAAVLDLCTGSGMLAIAAALGGADDVAAVDISRRQQDWTPAGCEGLLALKSAIAVAQQHADIVAVKIGHGQVELAVTPEIPCNHSLRVAADRVGDSGSKADAGQRTILQKLQLQFAGPAAPREQARGMRAARTAGPKSSQPERRMIPEQHGTISLKSGLFSRATLGVEQ